MAIGERIKKLRKSRDITQQEFGRRIGIKQNSVALIESEKRNISDQAILSICREFNVNEEWLRTGAGEMFKAKSEDEELKSAVDKFLAAETPDFRKRLLKVLAALEESEWAIIERRLREILDGRPAPAESASDTPIAQETPEEYRARLHRELDAQLDLEQAAKEKSTASLLHTKKNMA